MAKQRLTGFRKPIDSGGRKPVGLAVIKSGETETGIKFAECSCGAPFVQQRDKVRNAAIDRHLTKKHGGRGIWM